MLTCGSSSGRHVRDRDAAAGSLSEANRDILDPPLATTQPGSVGLQRGWELHLHSHLHALGLCPVQSQSRPRTKMVGFQEALVLCRPGGSCAGKTEGPAEEGSAGFSTPALRNYHSRDAL